jgi:hypothetical protein
MTTTAEPRRPKKSLLEQAIDYERAKRQAKTIVDAEQQPRLPLRELTIRELFDRPTPDYLIDQLLPEGALAELIGDSETLKSFIAIDLGLSIASGQPNVFGQPVVKHGPVLYIVAEGAGAFQFRLRAWGAEHKVNLDKVPFYSIAAPVNLRDPSFQEELTCIVARVRPLLVVVDTLHRCIPGAEENSSRDVGEVVGFSTRLQAQTGVAILFLHHPPKNDPNGRGRGSGALYYAADTELSSVLEGDEQPDGTKVITLSVKKQKDDSKFSIALKNCVVPVLDDDGQMTYRSGREITSCVLRLADQADIAASRVHAEDALEQKVLAFLRVNPGKTKAEIREAVKMKTNTVNACVEALEKAGLVKFNHVKRDRTYRDEYVATELPTGVAESKPSWLPNL